MTQEQMERYQLRLTQAGIGEYAVILLEVEMQWIREALEAFDQKQPDSFVALVKKAQMAQQQLMDILNPENAVAKDVYSVFIYINRQLIHSQFKKDPLDLQRCVGMLEKYHKSFLELEKTDTQGAIMDTGERVYAGLTYGSDGLVENSVGGMDFSV